MKKKLFALMIMLLPLMAQADFLGIKKTDEFISMRVITLDSSGIRTKPDSVHVFTYLDGGTALQFNTRSTTYPFAIGIDTSKIYGDTTYWFVDQIQDIDGTPTPADYTLTINIVMWGDGGIPTDNWGTVQVLGDSLDLYLAEIRDTTFGTIDTLQSQDSWVAQQTFLSDVGDTIFAIIDTLQRFTKPATDTLQGIIDTLQNQDNWVATLANQTLMKDSLQVALDSVRATLDTLQNQDDWAAKEASLGDSAATIFSEVLSSYTTLETFGAAMLGLAPIQDSVMDSTANTAIAFKTSIPGSKKLQGQSITFITGINGGESRTIVDYVQIGVSGSFITVDEAFILPPASNNIFVLLGGRTSRVDLSGYAAIDFDDAVGDISAAQIETNAITAAKIAANSITAGQIDGTFREEIWNVPFSDAATAAGSMWDSLNNSSYVQGASGFDSSSLAGWIWNTPQSNHTIAGTFGKYLDAEISSIGSGSGAFSYKLVTYDSTISQVIPGTNLAVRNINQSALIAVGKSDMLGLETFNLDADSFIIVATSPGYIYQTFDTLIVTGAGIDTVFGDQFDPGSPASPALCRVYGYLYSVSAVPEKDAVVTAYLPAGAARSGNLIISPFMVTTTSDSSGYFYLDLIRSDSLVPAATQYDLIIERSDGTIVHKRVTVPDSTSWQLDW